MSVLLDSDDIAQALPPGSNVGAATVGAPLLRRGDVLTYAAEHPRWGGIWIHEYWPEFRVERSGGRMTPRPTTVGLAVDKGLAAFTRRARAWTALPDHPNLAKGLEVVEQNGTTYMLAASPHGSGLFDDPGASWLTTPDALEAVRGQLAAALGGLHAANLPHGALEPRNIWIEATDRGVELVLIGPGAVSKDRLAAGYAPIEQYEAPDIGAATPAWDIYAACAVLYLLAVGAPPLEARRRLYRDRKETVSARARLGAPPTVLQLIDAGLAIEAGDRPSSLGKALLRPARRRKAASTARAGQGQRGKIKPTEDPPVAAAAVAAAIDPEAVAPPEPPPPLAPEGPDGPDDAVTSPEALEIPPPEPEPAIEEVAPPSPVRAESDVPPSEEDIRLPGSGIPRRRRWGRWIVLLLALLLLALSALGGAVIALRMSQRVEPASPPAREVGALVTPDPVRPPKPTKPSPANGPGAAPGSRRPAKVAEISKPRVVETSRPKAVVNPAVPPPVRRGEEVCRYETKSVCFPGTTPVEESHLERRFLEAGLQANASARNELATRARARAQVVCENEGGVEASNINIRDETCGAYGCSAVIGFSCAFERKVVVNRPTQTNCRDESKRVCAMVYPPARR